MSTKSTEAYFNALKNGEFKKLLLDKPSKAKIILFDVLQYYVSNKIDMETSDLLAILESFKLYLNNNEIIEILSKSILTSQRRNRFNGFNKSD